MVWNVSNTYAIRICFYYIIFYPIFFIYFFVKNFFLYLVTTAKIAKVLKVSIDRFLEMILDSVASEINKEIQNYKNMSKKDKYTYGR